MEKVKLNIARCKGCHFCVSVCPTNALTVSKEINDKGYNPVEIDQEKCRQCGSCYRICPDYVFEIL